MLDYGYYNMDCIEGMKQFPDNYFDLAIVDPPYGIGQGGAKIKVVESLQRVETIKIFKEVI